MFPEEFDQVMDWIGEHVLLPVALLVWGILTLPLWGPMWIYNRLKRKS